MKPDSKWVQIAFRDSFSKDKSKLQKSFSQSSKSPHSSRHSFTLNHLTSNQSHYFSQIPSTFNFFTRSAVYHISPSVDEDSGQFRRDFQQYVEEEEEKKPKMSKIQYFPKLLENIQQTDHDAQFKNYLNHLSRMQQQIAENRKEAERLFEQQQQRVKVARKNLIYAYSKKASQLKDPELKTMVRKESLEKTKKVQSKEKSGAKRISQVKSQKNLMIDRLREKVKKKEGEKNVRMEKKSEQKKLEATNNFGKIFHTLNEMKSNIERLHNVEQVEQKRQKREEKVVPKNKYTAVQAKIPKSKEKK